jgi:hypothetical protein
MSRAKAKKKGQLWSDHQDNMLRRAFRYGGWKAAVDMELKHRSPQAIKMRIHRLGLVSRAKENVAMAADVMTALGVTAQNATGFLRRHPEAYKIGRMWHLPLEALDAEVERRKRATSQPPLYYMTRQQVAEILGVTPPQATERMLATDSRKIKWLKADTGRWAWVYHEQDVFALRDAGKARRKAS